jgi:hypothetical protein
MRCVLKKLSLLLAAFLVMAVPVLAGQNDMIKVNEQGQQGVKNECLLVASYCADQVDTIQQKIDRIKGEIDRGTSVYTTEELNKLHRQLDEAIKNMNDLTAGS